MMVCFVFIFVVVLELAFGKTLPSENAANYLMQIPKYIELTKELNAKKITLEEAFPGYFNLTAVSIDQVDFVYYSQEDPTGTKVEISDADQITEKTKFNKDLETVFLIHGWQNTCSSSICNLVHDSLLLNHDFNYFTVCWDEPANKEYFEALWAVSQVGQFLGDFIKNMSSYNNYDLSKIILVGHSLGAHVAGWAGKENNGSLKYIVALDPAGPLFFEWDPANRVDKTDARYVQAIHTDGVPFIGLGVSYSVGHVDFWPNGGAGQPGCEVDILGLCSHGRSYRLFAESINTNKFYSRKCTDYKNYTLGNCKTNANLYLGGYVFSELTEDLKGNYYLKTDNQEPFGLGDIGL